MNKTEVISKLSLATGLIEADCSKVLESLEDILREELESSKSVSNALDKVYKLMQLFRN